MFVLVFWTIVYLIGLAQWAKRLKAKEVPLNRRRLYGVLVAIADLAMAVYAVFIKPVTMPEASIVVGKMSLGLIMAILGFVVVVYCPKWIVGKYGE